MKFKFIYPVLVISLLFLFISGRDTNQKKTENYHSNDYEVHFVVHKPKKAKTENFLERKKKRIQKKLNKLVKKFDKAESNKEGKGIPIFLSVILLIVLFFFVIRYISLMVVAQTAGSLIGATSTAPASAGAGTGLSLLIFGLIILLISLLAKKEQPQKD